MFYLWCKASSGELRTWVWNVDQIAVTCQVVGFTCQGSSATGCRMTGEHSSTLHPEDTQKPSNWHIPQHVGTLYPIQTYLYYKISVEFTNWYWIHPANIWDTGAGSRSAHCQIWICIACLPPTLGQYMSVEFTNWRAIVRSYSFIALAVGSPTVVPSDGKSLTAVRQPVTTQKKLKFPHQALPFIVDKVLRGNKLQAYPLLKYSNIANIER